MKHLPKNNIQSLTAKTEQVNYEADNLLDEHPSRLWKAKVGAVGETLTVDIVGGCSDIAVFGTNAATATVSVVDPNAMEWGDDGVGNQDEWGDDGDGNTDLWANTDLSGVTATVTENNKRSSLWLSLSETIPASCVLTLRLVTDRADTVEAGVLRAALASGYGVSAPEAGLIEGSIDYSIESQLQNGGRYYKKRDVVRRFEGQLITTREEWFNLKITLDDLGRKPTSWNITTADNNNWVVFGYLMEPEGIYTSLTTTAVNFELIEVLS
jgi:hypothetical protein